MIVEAILNLLVGAVSTLFEFAATLIPAAPLWWAEAAAYAHDAYVGIAPPIRHLLPIGPGLQVGVFLIGLMVACGLLRLARRILSLFTGGGGNA